MNNKGVAIKYGNVAPEAKENFVPTASENEFDTLAQLQQYNLYFPNYANPCEPYSVLLDGEATPFPSNAEKENIGLISKQLSGDDGIFAQPIVLTLESNGQYSSQGFTLTFDSYNNIYATQVKIKWIRITYQGIYILDEKEFYPNDAVYFCNNAVENYNKIIITFYSINMPQNRLKLRAIDYGYGTYFYGDELRNIKLIQEIDPISSEISINTADFTFDSKSSIEYSFQVKQPLSIYFNGNLKATTFVRSAKRTSKNLWAIQSEDYIGLLDSVPFQGGIYNNENAINVIEQIFNVAKVPYEIDEVFNSEIISGYIPYTTCRGALMQVAFAIQAIVDTSNSDVVKVFAHNKEVKQTIPLNRIMQGQNFEDLETVTGVEITSHTYQPISDTLNVYDASASGIGKNIFVKFSEPLHNLSISNGEIISSGANYAVINANAGCVLIGQKYSHTTQTKRKNNPVVSATTIERIVAIENATLVSANNIDKVLYSCYNYIIKTKNINLKIVEGKHLEYVQEAIQYGQIKYGEFKYGENIQNKKTIYDDPVDVGDCIQTETGYLGKIEGTIIKQTFNLNGGIIIKDAIMR